MHRSMCSQVTPCWPKFSTRAPRCVSCAAAEEQELFELAMRPVVEGPRTVAPDRMVCLTARRPIS